MSYVPDDQKLEGPISTLLDGIRGFSDAVQKRMESGDWSEEHIEELMEIKFALLKMEVTLHRMRSNYS